MKEKPESMKQRRVAVTISLPPGLAEEYSALARREAKNRSQLFRDMFLVYRTQSLEREFYDLQREGRRLAGRKKIFKEEDVEKIVFAGR
jgi:metal-responsive CopG/Arc/MetJ family transcriptional regulator